MTINFGDSLTALANDIDLTDQELTRLRETFQLLHDQSLQSAYAIEQNLAELQDASNYLYSSADFTIKKVNEAIAHFRSTIEAAKESRSSPTETLRIMHQQLADTIDACAVSIAMLRDFAKQTGQSNFDNIVDISRLLQSHAESCDSLIEQVSAIQRNWTEQARKEANTIFNFGEEFCVNLKDELSSNLNDAYEALFSCTTSEASQLLTGVAEANIGFQDSVGNVLVVCEQAYSDFLSQFYSNLNELHETFYSLDRSFDNLSSVISTAANGMNTAMDASATGLKNAIQTLQELKEIFEKVA